MTVKANSLDSLEGVEMLLEFRTYPDGSLYQVMPKVNGEHFRCRCGCNVFHQPANDYSIFICNACDAHYKGE